MLCNVKSWVAGLRRNTVGLESQFGESLENIALHTHTLLPLINLEGHCYLFSWQLEEKRGFGDRGRSLGLQDQV